MSCIYPSPSRSLRDSAATGVSRGRQIALSSWQLILSLALVLFCANATFAISLDEYRDHVKQAIGALDLIHVSDEGQTQSQQNDFIAANLRRAREALPPHETIHWDGVDMRTDNSWLDDELREFEKLSTSDPNRALTLDRILERLQALEERLAEIDKAVRTSPPGKAEMKDRLGTILQRNEYAKTAEAESALTRLLRGASRWISSLMPKNKVANPGETRAISRLSAIFAVVLALAALAYALRLLAPRLLHNRRARKTKARARVVLGEQLEPNQSATDLLAEAEALARAGDLRGAIRRGYIALLVELADRKIVSLAQHKTNRDYLRGLRGIEGLYLNMLALTNNFEQHWYGLVPADESDWVAFRAGYKKVSSFEFRVSSS